MLTNPRRILLARGSVRAAIALAERGVITSGRLLPPLDALPLGGGRELRAAIMYADIRQFTQMVVSAGSRAVLAVLNAFVSQSSRIAADYHGEFVDCAGDRVLLAFCRPRADRTRAPIQASVTAALWLQTLMALAIRPELEARGYPGPSCGIGIDYGDVVVARVGIRNRNKLVFIGEPSVLAAKLEDRAAPGEVLMSPLVYENRPEYLTPASGWEVRAYPRPEAAEFYGVQGVFAT